MIEKLSHPKLVAGLAPTCPRVRGSFHLVF